MATEIDIKVRQSDTYKVIHVSGYIPVTTYEGTHITVLSEVPDFTQAVQSHSFQPSKVKMYRDIECELVLTPSNLKKWALALQKELTKYEKTYGHILSPEEVNTKRRDNASNTPI